MKAMVRGTANILYILLAILFEQCSKVVTGIKSFEGILGGLFPVGGSITGDEISDILACIIYMEGGADPGIQYLKLIDIQI